MKEFGKPVAEAVAPIVRVLDSPLDESLRAFVEGRRIPVTGPGFDPAAADRLRGATLRLTAGVRGTQEAVPRRRPPVSSERICSR